VFASDPAEFDPRKYLGAAIAKMQSLCESRYEEFGSAGHAGGIKPVPLGEMAKKYKSGELDMVAR
jgi:fructose-bisphosphate aldolase class II